MVSVGDHVKIIPSAKKGIVKAVDVEDDWRPPEYDEIIRLPGGTVAVLNKWGPSAYHANGPRRYIVVPENLVKPD